VLSQRAALEGLPTRARELGSQMLWLNQMTDFLGRCTVRAAAKGLAALPSPRFLSRHADFVAALMTGANKKERRELLRHF